MFIKFIKFIFLYLIALVLFTLLLFTYQVTADKLNNDDIKSSEEVNHEIKNSNDKNDETKSFEEENYGIKYATNCEVCKYVALELEDKLKETGQTSEILETGYSFDKEKTKTEYKRSELRLIETMENLCDRLLTYNVHKERKDSTRFAKGISQTFQTLNNLVDRGVKVDLGIPKPLWDKPSAEITDLKTKCERLLENYENEIEDWYWKEDRNDLTGYLCVNKVLKGKDTECLNEKLSESVEDQVKTKDIKTEL